MKHSLVTGGLLLFFSQAAFGGPCLPGSLQDYIDLGAAGCQLGAVNFGSFQTGPDIGLTPIDPASVQISPGGGFLSPTLLVTVNQTAMAGEIFDSFFRFSAMGPLAGGSITLNDPTATGDAAVTGILDICAGGVFSGNEPSGCSGMPGNAVVFAIAGDQQLSASAVLGGSFFDVFTDLTIDGGPGGSAFLGSASLQLAAVPEPSAAVLATAGLALLGVLRVCRTLQNRRKTCSIN